MVRFTLKQVMLGMALIAVCAAALSQGDWFWARLLFTIALAIKLGAVFGAIFLRGKPRGFWTGFAMFGWAAWLISNYPLLQIAEHQLIVNEIAKMLKEFTPEANDGIVILHKTHGIAIFSFERTIHTTFELVFAFFGGVLCCWACSGRLASTSEETGGEPPAG